MCHFVFPVSELLKQQVQVILKEETCSLKFQKAQSPLATFLFLLLTKFFLCFVVIPAQISAAGKSISESAKGASPSHLPGVS